MKLYFLVIVWMVLGCGSNQQNTSHSKKQVVSENCFDYPIEIDTLHMKDLYDSARWYVFTRCCDIPYKSKKDSSLNKQFGELELKYGNLLVKHDTVLINFNFIDDGHPILPSMTRDNRQLATGMGFNINTKKKIFIISTNMFISYKNNPSDRYENPMQPEVIKYINVNWDRLNNCFKELALQKGIKK